MIETENTASTPFDQNLPHLGNVEDITPHPKSQTYIVFGLVLFLLLTAGAAAFMFSQNQSLKSQIGLPTFRLPWTQVTCTQEGQVYKAGESVPSSDGCNTCACDESGQIACTETACMDDAQVQDESNNKQNTPVELFSLYSITLPEELEFTHSKTGMLEQSELYTSMKYPSLTLTLEQTWRNGFGCSILDSGESIVIDNREIRKEIWIGIPTDYPDENATALCDIQDAAGFRGVILELKAPTEDLWGHNLVLAYDVGELSDTEADRILNQILSTFEFTDNQSPNDEMISFHGRLESMERPSPEINYDYQLQLDTPYFDELNAQGPRNITSIVVVPENESIRTTLAANIGKSISIEGVIEWGLAETRHLKATKIAVKPGN